MPLMTTVEADAASASLPKRIAHPPSRAAQARNSASVFPSRSNGGAARVTQSQLGSCDRPLYPRHPTALGRHELDAALDVLSALGRRYAHDAVADADPHASSGCSRKINQPHFESRPDVARRPERRADFD